MKIVINGETAYVYSGKSAYEVAVDNGFTGTEQEWLESLKGEKGEKGDAGSDGPQGPQGEAGSTEDIYSTEETRIGTWIDGKPIYRKCYSFTRAIAGGTDYTFATMSEFNMERIVNHRANFAYTAEEKVSGSALTCMTSNDNIYVQNKITGSTQVFNIVAIIEYTKTTDTATREVPEPLSTMVNELPSYHTAAASAASTKLEGDILKIEEAVT